MVAAVVPIAQTDRALIASSSLSGTSSQVQMMNLRFALDPNLPTSDTTDRANSRKPSLTLPCVQ